MTTKQAQRKTALDAPKESGKFTLYPVTFGLLEWLQSVRKNPLIVGGKRELKDALELCYAFTLPSDKVVAIPSAKLASKVKEFTNALTPAEFFRIQKHAENELLKFNQTAVVPKKSQRPKLKQRPKR